MRYVDLFCGVGGVGLGFARVAGWECALAVDHDATALRIYAANLPRHPTLCHDLAHPLPRSASSPAVDVVAGGAPCQDHSRASSVASKQTGARAALTTAFADHVEALAPAWVLFENVVCAQRRPQFLALCARLAALGYAHEWRVVDTAADLGMAQRRRRLVLLAHRDAARVARAWAAYDAAAADAAAAPRETMRACFARHGLHVPTGHVFYPAHNCNQNGAPSVFSLDGCAPTVRGRRRPLPPNYAFVPRDGTHDRADVTALQTEHLLALQGFPPGFRWAEAAARTQTNQYVGNAVPPPLAEALARAIQAADVGGAGY